jgi:hypothetical protein
MIVFAIVFAITAAALYITWITGIAIITAIWWICRALWILAVAVIIWLWHAIARLI